MPPPRITLAPEERQLIPTDAEQRRARVQAEAARVEAECARLGICLEDQSSRRRLTWLKPTLLQLLADRGPLTTVMLADLTGARRVTVSANLNRSPWFRLHRLHRNEAWWELTKEGRAVLAGHKSECA
jgi:hypothetical protein